MEIRKSTRDDLDRIMELYAQAREFMAANGNPRQWSLNQWPPLALIEDDIETGKSYVCEHDGRIVGTFYYDSGYKIEDTYNLIENGHWIGSDDYDVVHRITGDGSVKGIGSFCLNWAYEKHHHLRIDTHPDNIVMQNLLQKLGFTMCGYIHVREDNDRRLAYEKI